MANAINFPGTVEWSGEKEGPAWAIQILSGSPSVRNVTAIGQHGPYYVVAVNCFDGMLHHRIEDVREALTIDETVPIVTCDARNRQSTKLALITLVEHAMRQWMSVRAG